MQEQATVSLDVPLPEKRVFRYQAMQDILQQLITDPFGEFTQQELAMMIDADVSSVSRSVDLLDRLGVLAIDTGRPARIRLDPDHLSCSDPLFLIAQSEFRKPIRAFRDTLESRVDSTRSIEGVVGIVLYGSVARGTADRRSDIDLLVVLDGDTNHGRRLVSRIERDLGEESFDGDRYEFDVRVETLESSLSVTDALRSVFDDGIVIERTETLGNLRRTVYEHTGPRED
ncbi:nucleotidyltransferase domain-containing protein [Halalkalicoccus tibetensis]|uniref:Nucleotidyltransferase domain-containing protein n=1 Tax=Halalkalicoccus tibetensis TaxID=175632 RepID=A0ABD5V489_9EURY